MVPSLYPIKFKPIYKDYLWGGHKIIQHFDRSEPDGIYAESWEVTCRPEGDSIVENGPLAGLSLSELCDTYKQDLLGALCPSEEFPLLIKIIDSNQSLSVQVHPSDESAKQFGGEAKTEMWYFLDAEPGASVYAGLQPGVMPKSFKEAVKTDDVEHLLHHIPAHTGDVVFIPGGRVHAINKGCLIFEVQQNSNTTYRLYDWGRVDAKGKPRELHVKQALQHIRWDDETPSATPPEVLLDNETCTAKRLITTDYFILNQCQLKHASYQAPHPETFKVLFVEQGSVRIEASEVVTLRAGETCLIPACIADYALFPETDEVTLLAVMLPES